ncbi:glycosyl transferase family 1 [Spirochaetia bacterium]|nr:glycosyl transferase family 1 [Spirochaetia bacterium]
MKIVMFTESYWPRVNGVTISVESFAAALRKNGHTVLIICPFYPQADLPPRLSLSNQENEGKIPESCIIRVPSVPLFISKEDRLSKSHKMFWVSKRIDKFEPDIIHINSEFVTADFGYYFARTRMIPAIYTAHTLWKDYMVNYMPKLPMFVLRIILWIVMSLSIRRAYRVITPSKAMYSVAMKYKPKKEPYILPSGIDTSLFNNSKEDADKFREIIEMKYPNLKQKRILLFAGRVGREKNIDFILNIAPKIIERHPDTIFVIVGNGPDMFWYRAECDSRGISGNIIFTGYMERRDLSLMYSISTLFVFPSLTETQGMVTIEAMISGIPVVAIGENGTLTVMNGDNGGFMVKNDIDEFTQRIFDLLEDKELYARKSAEAREYASNWSIEIMTKRLEEIYIKTINDYNNENTKPVK